MSKDADIQQRSGSGPCRVPLDSGPSSREGKAYRPFHRCTGNDVGAGKESGGRFSQALRRLACDRVGRRRPDRVGSLPVRLDLSTGKRAPVPSGVHDSRVLLRPCVDAARHHSSGRGSGGVGGGRHDARVSAVGPQDPGVYRALRGPLIGPVRGVRITRVIRLYVRGARSGKPPSAEPIWSLPFLCNGRSDIDQVS